MTTYETPLPRSLILARAGDLITGDRAASYGDFGEQMTSIAAAFNGITGEDLAPRDVATLLILLKLRRMQTSPDRDGPTDLCGYAALFGEFFLCE